MKNSQRVKNILIELAIADRLPLDMTELDSNLFSFCDPEVTAFGFSVEDIIGQAEDNNIELSADQATEIIELINRKGDVSTGISWDTVDCFTEEYLKNN